MYFCFSYFENIVAREPWVEQRVIEASSDQEAQTKVNNWELGELVELWHAADFKELFGEDWLNEVMRKTPLFNGNRRVVR